MYITQDNINLIKLEVENMKKGLELAPKIKEVIKSFDNKVYSIRLSNKLNEINSNIYARLNNMDYLEIYYYYENRSIHSTTSDCWNYTKNSQLYFVHCSCSNIHGEYQNGLKRDKRINAQYLISEIDAWIEYRKKYIEEIEYELEHLEELKKDYQAWQDAREKLMNHNHAIREYFEVKTY
jgi:hypothetical protein